MKKLIAGILAGVLMCSAPIQAFAADTTSAAQPEVITVSYADVENMVRSGNQTIRSNDKSFDSLSDNDVVQQEQEELRDSYSELQGVNTTMKQTLASLPAGQDALAASLQGNIASLSALCSLLSNQREQLDVDDDTIDETQIKMEDAADQIVSAAQQLYLTYQQLDSQRDQLAEKLRMVNDTLKAEQTRCNLGLITQTDLLTEQQNTKSLTDSVNALASQMETIKGSLRVMLGYSGDYDLNLSSMPEIDNAFISGMNYDADYDTAKEQNDSIQETEKEKDRLQSYKDKDLDSTVDDYNAAALKYLQAVNSFDANFKQVYNAVGQKQSELATATSALQAKQQVLDAQKSKYNLGLISSLDLENAQLDVNTAVETAEQAKINLFSAVESYRWALRGLITQPSSQN